MKTFTLKCENCNQEEKFEGAGYQQDRNIEIQTMGNDELNRIITLYCYNCGAEVEM